jgi:5'(3')-deoxyribonucleotidase
MQNRKILYFDMDNVLVDFQSGIDQLSEKIKCEYEGRLDEVPGIFSLMKPVEGAVEAVNLLSQYFECNILSTAPWKNPSAWTDKAMWVHKYFGDKKDSVFYKRLIITHRKDLNKGDYLIDDRTKNGAGEFQGELIQFGSERFPNWEAVTEYLVHCSKGMQRLESVEYGNGTVTYVNELSENDIAALYD